MTTDLIGQRVSIQYHHGGPVTEGIVRAIDLSRKDYTADMILVIQKDDGTLSLHTGCIVTVVKPASPDLKIKDDMVVWVDKGKVCFEVMFEDDSGYRLTMPPSTAAELGSALRSNAVKANKEVVDDKS